MRALAPLSWVYGAAVGLRNLYFDRAGATKLSVPVVSVGNVTVGGSGKTPLVAALAKELLARDLPVAVVSRGYGRENRAPYVLVSDGKDVLADARAGGDEPVELARRIPGLVVAVGADRVGVVETLLEALGPHVVVLDDGFQHRRLARDVDLVCFDCGEAEASLRLLPAGRLREPLSSLKRASAVVLTRWSEGCRTPELGDVPVIRAASRVAGFTRLDGPSVRLEADAFHDEAVAVAAGIARPERVRESMDARIVHFVSRRDHHRWSGPELARILDDAAAQGARALLTTGKDAVKMTFGSEPAVPVYRIDVETEILDIERLRELMVFPALVSE